MKTFFNTGEFAEEHLIDNVEKTIAIDNEKIKEVSKVTNQGISLGEILYSIPVVEYGNKIPHIGDSQIFDKKLMYISSVSENIGVYEIILTQNLGE
jgi:hypothetical protein